MQIPAGALKIQPHSNEYVIYCILLLFHASRAFDCYIIIYHPAFATVHLCVCVFLFLTSLVITLLFSRMTALLVLKPKDASFLEPLLSENVINLDYANKACLDIFIAK